MSQNKNYIGFVNDHSGSMDSIKYAAMQDYNANITAIKDAATREMLDTVVSVVGIGLPSGYGGNHSEVKRQVVISNPHVLKPVTSWPCPGGTPLYDGIGEMIELLRSLPDANDPNVSFLIMITTDGEEAHSRKYNSTTLKNLIETVSRSGQWTFAFRVPKNANRTKITSLGIPLDNIQFWETTTEGMKASTLATTQAVDSYFTARSNGLRSSNAFYANAAQVNTQILQDVTKDVSLYVVDPSDNGIEIRDFILKHRMEYLKGSAFYQLTKTEARVQHTKLILVRDRNTGKIYAGKEARQMIGLPTDRNARLHPGDHKNYDLFIQSESVNRKLVGGTGVVYWAAIGKQFTEADLAYLKPKVVNNGVVQLPTVAPTNRPTPSPIPVTKKIPAVAQAPMFATREMARAYCRANNKSQASIKKVNGNWVV
jgi:hypothetical protein